MQMAFSRVLLLSLVSSFVLLTLLQSHPTTAAGSTAPSYAPSPTSINCDGACTYRCSKSWMHEMCMQTCMACCHKCACVPPGPTASRDVCPCYAKLKNPKGKNKCP